MSSWTTSKIEANGGVEWTRVHTLSGSGETSTVVVESYRKSGGMAMSFYGSVFVVFADGSHGPSVDLGAARRRSDLQRRAAGAVKEMKRAAVTA